MTERRDSRAIGVFDSGLGGLTAVRQLLLTLPNENIVYFGDTARVPYGTRGEETIIKYAISDVNFLLTQNVKCVLVACGTVSTVALDALRSRFSVPIDGVVEAAAAAALAASKNKRVGLIATPTAVASGAYERELRRLDPNVEVAASACPLFVPLVENGRTDKNDVVVRTIASEYLKPISDFGADTLILGCTHYPLLADAIASVLGGGVKLIDTGAELVKASAKKLADSSLLAPENGCGSIRYYVTDAPSGFAKNGEVFLGRRIAGDVERIDIEKY